jgi:hypothetical protein
MWRVCEGCSLVCRVDEPRATPTGHGAPRKLPYRAPSGGKQHTAFLRHVEIPQDTIICSWQCLVECRTSSSDRWWLVISRQYLLPSDNHTLLPSEITTMATVRNSIAIATTLLSGASAISNGLAVTPPMGWVRCPLRSFAELAGCGPNGNRTTGTLSAAMSLKIFFTPLRSKSLV